ncbi:MAG: hypothetical protein ABW321_24075 [Polyangiales bacterium]
MSGRLRALFDDQRGAALAETLVTFPILLFVFLGLYMFIYILAGHIIVQRAADAAARAAVVFMPDSQIYYGGDHPEKHEYVELAAQVALLPSKHLVLDSVTWNQAAGFEPLRAEVRAHFDCGPFLASFMCGVDRRVAMSAAVTFPYQQGFPDR